MPTKVIEFYNNFKCKADKCEYTCCKGWGIAIDDATYMNYKKESGILGKILKFSTQQNIYIGPVLRKFYGKCLFCSNGLCKFQCDNRQDLLPDVCKVFPRLCVDYGDYKEITLELSCIKAAELFICEPKRFSFIESNTSCIINWPLENDAPVFLDFLLKDREKILDYLWNNTDKNLTVSLTDKMKAIFAHVYEEFNLVAADNIKGAFNISSFNADKGIFFPIRFLNDLIYIKLSYSQMRYRNPFMYKAIKNYKKYFGKLYETDSEAFYNKAKERMYKKYPELERTFTAYLSYLIQQTYCLSYEDYYIIGPLLLSILHTEFVILFFTVAFLSGEELTPTHQAAIIANTEKIVRHNSQLNDYIINKVRKEFFNG